MKMSSIQEMVKGVGLALADQAYDHTMETGHTKFGLLQTRDLGDNELQFYKECLECKS